VSSTVDRRPTEIVDRFLAAFAAVDALNGFARCREARHVPRDAIYYLKDRALRAADVKGLAVHRLVDVAVSCRTCNGSGLYLHGHRTSSEGGRVAVTSSCRGCTGKGSKRLGFVESTIAGRWTWHSPVRPPAAWGVATQYALTLEARLRAAGQDFVRVDEGDWRPNQPGQLLTPGQVAAAFCTAETMWLVPPLRDDDYATDREYMLFLGDEGGGACVLCGETAGPIDHYLIDQGRALWSSPACRCEEDHDTGRQPVLGVFDALRERGIPEQLAADPHVQRWLASHPKTERVTHGR